MIEKFDGIKLRKEIEAVKESKLPLLQSQAFQVWTDEILPKMKDAWNESKYGPFPGWLDRSVDDLVEDFRLNNLIEGDPPVHIFEGVKRLIQYTPTDSLVGKTIEAVGSSSVEGNYGEEPMVILYFTDGTRHGFVLPQDE